MCKKPKEGNCLEEEANQLMSKYAYKHNLDKKDKEEETYRTCLRRQRDKILYSGGFRRLQGKAQVMPTHKLGDHRTRLTHTLEVEQIAISVADALGLNKDLVSAIALGHDVGHTPFGHAGEKILNELLKDCGGFYHPIQSVKYLWEKYGDKISYVVYEGILKHDSDMYCIEKDKKENIVKNHFIPISNKKIQTSLNEKKDNFLEAELCTPPSTLEAQVVIWADKIAYITHDFEDFQKTELYADIAKSHPDVKNDIEKAIVNITGKNMDIFQTRDLIRPLTTSLIKQSFNNLNSMEIENIKNETYKKILEKEKNIETKDKKKRKRKAYLRGQIINIEDNVFDAYIKLREIVDKNYIQNIKIKKSDIKGSKIIESLFHDLVKNFDILPQEYQINSLVKNFQVFPQKYQKISKISNNIIDFMWYFNKKQKCENVEKKKRAAHYISTMSDDYARKLYLHLNSLIDNFEI